MARLRPEERGRYKELMKKSVREGGYEEDFKVEKSGRRDQDVHVTVDVPSVFSELPEGYSSRMDENQYLSRPTRRYVSAPSLMESMAGQSRAVYLALFALLAVGVGLTWHGVAIGGATYILNVIHEYGFSQAALHVLGMSAGAKQVGEGVALGVGSAFGVKVTHMLDKGDQ